MRQTIITAQKLQVSIGEAPVSFSNIPPECVRLSDAPKEVCHSTRDSKENLSC